MKQWFIQSGDEVVGPLSSRELRLLAAAGGLSAETLVTVDRQHWVHAEEVPGLEMKPRQEVAVAAEVIDVDPAPEISQERSHPKSKSDTPSSKWPQWILIVVATVAAQVVSRYWHRPRPAAPIPVVAAPLAPETAIVKPTAHQIMGAATLTYWSTARASLQAAVREADRTKNVKQMIGAITRVENHPVTNVDPSATRTILEVCASLRAVIQLRAQSNDPGLFTETLARVYNGVPVGTGLEIQRDTKRVQQQLQTTTTNVTQMRELLSQHYGVEFPPLME